LILVPILIMVAGLRVETGAGGAPLDGRVTREEIESWREYLRAEGRVGPPTVRQEVEEIVLLRALDRRFESASPAQRREVDRRHRLWQLELAERRLRDTLRTEAAPKDAEVRAVFEANPAAWGEPASWVLENIFKRYPEQASDAEKARVRAAMEAVRRRALAGEDFPSLAKTESESETRLRGGSMGAPYLHQLAPPVAAVVSKLAAGDISPVFEVPGGFVLLRCVRVLEAKPPNLEEARPRIARPRGEQRFQQTWAELSERLRAETAPVLHPEAARGGQGEAVVASVREGSSRRDLTRAELDVFLSARRIDSGKIPDETLMELLGQRVQLEGFYREAAARGLVPRAGDEALSRWKTLELRARSVEEALPIPEPTAADLRAAFEARRTAFVAPPRARLEALRLWIKPDQRRDLYEDAREWGERLASGTASFEEAERALTPPAERVQLGWMDDDQVWLRGLNFDDAVKATKPGGATRLLQEGKELMIVRVLAREPGRQLSFEEAREVVRRRLRDEARQRASADLRRQILDQYRLVPSQ
jgi:hypothetical protein